MDSETPIQIEMNKWDVGALNKNFKFLRVFEKYSK